MDCREQGCLYQESRRIIVHGASMAWVYCGSYSFCWYLLDDCSCHNEMGYRPSRTGLLVILRRGGLKHCRIGVVREA